MLKGGGGVQILCGDNITHRERGQILCGDNITNRERRQILCWVFFK